MDFWEALITYGHNTVCSPLTNTKKARSDPRLFLLRIIRLADRTFTLELVKHENGHQHAYSYAETTTTSRFEILT